MTSFSVVNKQIYFKEYLEQRYVSVLEQCIPMGARRNESNALVSLCDICEVYILGILSSMYILVTVTISAKDLYLI